MRSPIITVILCAMAVCALAADRQATDKKTAGPTPHAITIPKDAAANPNGTYNWTDKQGKKWIFVKTPFGVMKNPVTDDSPAKPSDAVATKAIDKGDTVRFERATPFGTTSWEKKKSELTDDERHILDAQPPAGDNQGTTNKADKND